ncbi:energy-coupling factor ABC transporter substrate-binding protein [Methanosphaerula palustris]|uniref:Cobalt transport protein CbiN n=1 Tax=Methanosphaerula palustris (strain ATCC BAA-1556 / DSM 19958 / E1-9c) TaxID=521011 RepID=B8GEB6_METPE|nr:energy-coupling factor ABC transporter substrate-binding protein [Methanosphaerula palustris]ACL17617.1 cobalt transport protein CbiN [Methanosphaerula palustris E1-9c]
MFKRKLEVFTLITLIAFVGLFIITSSGGTHEFTGSDDVGSDMIANLTGHSVDSFKPLIPQYVPPSGEIESSLFALQATFGGLVVGLVLGYWLGQRRSSPTL